MTCGNKEIFQPKVSIIVPVYKVECFLERCINSICNQTYSNLEIILVDDGSPDNCGTICDRFAVEDSRVIVIHKENGGQSSARNAGLDIATGEYIGFVDSDDWIDEDMYESLIEVARDTNADLVTGGYRFYRPWKIEKQFLDGDYNGKIQVMSNIEALNMFYFGSQMFGGITNMVWTKIYKKELIRSIRFCEGYNFGEDGEFTSRILYSASKVAKLDKSLYNYNIHLGVDSTSGMGVTVRKLKSHIEMSRRTYEYFKDKRRVEKILKHVESLYYGYLINGYYECWKRKEDKDFQKLKQEIISKILSHKNEIMKVRPDWKTRLFFTSKNIYCTFVWLLRWSKETKYKLGVLLTGKN